MLIVILFSFFFFILFVSSRWLHDIFYPDPAARKRHETEPHP